MITLEEVRQLALALPGTVEQDHCGRPSFRTGGRIFSTLWPEENRAMLKLPLEEQANFAAAHPPAFAPVPGGWGRMGCTFVQLEKVEPEVFLDALEVAWARVAPKKLLKDYVPNGVARLPLTTK
jgi:hypothetical protein